MIRALWWSAGSLGLALLATIALDAYSAAHPFLG